MKKVFISFVLVLIFPLMAAANSNLEALDGTYHCPRKLLIIDIENKSVRMIRKSDNAMLEATIVDGTDVLSPLKRSLGFVLLGLSQQDRLVMAMEVLKTQRGGLIVSELSLPKLEEEAESKKKSIELNTDDICIPLRKSS